MKALPIVVSIVFSFLVGAGVSKAVITQQCNQAIDSFRAEVSDLRRVMFEVSNQDSSIELVSLDSSNSGS